MLRRPVALGAGLRGGRRRRGGGVRGAVPAGAAHPALDVALRPVAHAERPGRHVAPEHRAGAGVRAVAHGHRRDDMLSRAGLPCEPIVVRCLFTPS